LPPIELGLEEELAYYRLERDKREAIEKTVDHFLCGLIGPRELVRRYKRIMRQGKMV
jgi:hypothetical protein